MPQWWDVTDPKGLLPGIVLQALRRGGVCECGCDLVPVPHRTWIQVHNTCPCCEQCLSDCSVCGAHLDTRTYFEFVGPLSDAVSVSGAACRDCLHALGVRPVFVAA